MPAFQSIHEAKICLCYPSGITTHFNTTAQTFFIIFAAWKKKPLVSLLRSIVPLHVSRTLTHLYVITTQEVVCGVLYSSALHHSERTFWTLRRSFCLLGHKRTTAIPVCIYVMYFMCISTLFPTRKQTQNASVNIKRIKLTTPLPPTCSCASPLFKGKTNRLICYFFQESFLLL